MLVEVIDALSWEAFLVSNSIEISDDLKHLRGLLSKQNADNACTKFSEVTLLSKPLLDKYAVFLAECQAKSDMASYFINVKRMIDLIKCLVTADREGNWPLHVSCIEASMLPGVWRSQLPALWLILFGKDQNIRGWASRTLSKMYDVGVCGARPYR